MKNCKKIQKNAFRSSQLYSNTERFSLVSQEISKYIAEWRLTDAVGFFEKRGCDSQTALFLIANLQDLVGGAE
jgi:hypothetical protein